MTNEAKRSLVDQLGELAADPSTAPWPARLYAAAAVWLEAERERQPGDDREEGHGRATGAIRRMHHRVARRSGGWGAPMTPFDIDCADAPFQAAERDAEERDPTEPIGPTEPDVQAETVALMIAHGFVEAEPTPEVRAANAAACALGDQLWALEQAERERNRN
jgi:hypothetical protein